MVTAKVFAISAASLPVVSWIAAFVVAVSGVGGVYATVTVCPPLTVVPSNRETVEPFTVTELTETGLPLMVTTNAEVPGLFVTFSDSLYQRTKVVPEAPTDALLSIGGV